MRRSTPLVLALAALLILGAPAGAAKKMKLNAKPFATGDPAVAQAAWVTHQGLADAGKSDHALVLKKLGPTAAVAASGANVHKATGTTLTELGFDYETGGHCTAVAPRFSVVLDTGTEFTFGCADATLVGTMVDRHGDAWNRIRFDDLDAVATDGVSVWPGFGSAEVQSVQLLFDEGTDLGPGLVRLDNLDVAGKLMGKPGNSKK